MGSAGTSVKSRGFDSLGFEEAWIAIAVPQPHTASHNFSVGAAATAVNAAVAPQFGA